MSASHKSFQRPFDLTKKKSSLDHLLDFGNEPSSVSDCSGTETQRLQKILEQIEEISARIDRLTEQG